MSAIVELGRYISEVRGRAVLVVGKSKVFRQIFAKAFPGFASEGILPDVDSLAPPTAG
jgi:hypothetical protein